MVIYEDNLDVNIRPAIVADAIAIIDLHFAAVHQSASSFYPPEVLNSWSTQPDETRYDHIWRALENGEELAGEPGIGSLSTRFVRRGLRVTARTT
jgi:hypothetical protein